MPQWSGLRPRHVEPFPLTALRSVLPLGAIPAVGDVRVTGVTHDSRQVRPGDLYAALPGAVTHGARFAASAVESGAVAVLTDPAGAELAGPLSDRDGDPVSILVVDHPRTWLGEVAAAVYGNPARDLLMLGVTGTNGKTTTTYLLESGLRAYGFDTGLIGTVETRIGDDVVASVRTTPEATDVHAILAVMRERGVRGCAMEVSSHALAFGRVDGVMFDVVGFTNLSQDHLDFHADLEDYFATKARLFTPRHARRGVVCVDDEHGRRLAKQAGIPSSTVATSAADSGVPGISDRVIEERPAWRVRREEATTRLTTPSGTDVALQVPIPGAFNVTNAALAVAMLTEAGITLETAVTGVGECPGVPGRMERVGGEVSGAPRVVVDYAHTPDALQNVLQALRDRPSEVTGGGRLIAVVGAGGDRDREKRRHMGQVAAEEADVLIVTDDNPRSEDPAQIRAAILAGANAVGQEDRAEVVEVADRREAIRAALARAHGPSDTVAVLGKGHEQGQEIAGTVYPFDDREVVREELVEWRR